MQFLVGEFNVVDVVGQTKYVLNLTSNLPGIQGQRYKLSIVRLCMPRIVIFF